MKKPIFFAGTILAVFATFQPLQASDPVIEGRVSGIELCPQFICGNAWFTGIYWGEVGGAPAVGTWLAAVNHDPLPKPNSGIEVDITGGHDGRST